MNNNNNNSIEAQIASIVNSIEMSKSKKIRKLVNEMKVSKAEVAKLLGIRYQFVRNVIVNDEMKNELHSLKSQKQD